MRILTHPEVKTEGTRLGDGMEENRMDENAFQYVITDMSYIYVGARYTYAQMMENENIPHKLKEVIFRIFLTEVADDTTPEAHLFYLKEDSASCKAYRKMKARFKMSVWENGHEKGAKKGLFRRKPGYVNREYTLEEILGNEELMRKKDMIIVEEVRISKLGLATIIV